MLLNLLQGAGQPPITKNYPVQTTNSPEVEKTRSMGMRGDSKIKPQLTSSQLPPNCLINSSSRNCVHFYPLLSTPLAQVHTAFDLNCCGSFLIGGHEATLPSLQSKSSYPPCQSNSPKAQLTTCQTSAPRDSLTHQYLVNKVQPHYLEIQRFLCSVPNLCSWLLFPVLPTHNLQCSQEGISTISQICLFFSLNSLLRHLPQFVVSHYPSRPAPKLLVHQIFSFPPSFGYLNILDTLSYGISIIMPPHNHIISHSIVISLWVKIVYFSPWHFPQYLGKAYTE